MDKLIKKTNLALVIGTHSWREQFVDAVTVSAGQWLSLRLQPLFLVLNVDRVICVCACMYVYALVCVTKMFLCGCVLCHCNVLISILVTDVIPRAPSGVDPFSPV